MALQGVKLDTSQKCQGLQLFWKQPLLLPGMLCPRRAGFSLRRGGHGHPAPRGPPRQLSMVSTLS